MQQGIQHYVKRQLFSIQNILKGVLTLILANVAIHSFALTTADNSVANDIKPVILKATKSVAHPAPPLEMAKPHLIQNRYLIEFDEPSFAEFETVQTNNRLNKTQKQAKQQTILRKQEEHIKQLQKQLPSLRINQRFTQLLNGVEVEIEKAHLKALKSLKHVKRVYPVKLRYLSLDASQQIIKAQAAWEAVGGQSKAGEGIKIAIVDTGIRNNNPMFNDEGVTPLDLSGNTHLNNNPDYCRSETGSADFCNNKIVVARWVDPILFGLDVYEQEYMSPMDFDGHGTHVAGIAAGRALSVNFNNANVGILGVAPASHLMIYKALYTSPFGGAYATDTMLLQALEWAVSDGADVINNSWGAGSGEDPDSSVYQTVFNNAESLGIVVVNAAGNTGHPGATINCPACIESGIAVANSTHGRFFGHAIATSEGTVYGYPGQAEPLGEDVNLNAVALRLLEPDNANGCAPITEAIPDSAAVVIAYTPLCPLSMSVQHASNAGAKLVLAYFDDVFGQATYEPLLPFADDYAIKVLGLSQTVGLQLEASIAANSATTVDISSLVEANVESQYADIINPFSSTGPNNNPNYLKPDLAAPGTNILSAYSPDEFSFGPFPFGDDELPGAVNNDPVFATLTGTSMASPHVAGAAALLKQQHPQWSVAQIKSALVNTAESNVLLGSEIAGPFEKGAGRLDLKRAMAPTLSFSQVSFSDPACIASCEFEFTVTNLTSDNQEWTLTTDFNNSLVHVMVSPASFSLSAEASQVINITVDVSNADPAHPLYNQWEFGRLVATSTNGLQLSMPLVANANDSSDQGSLLVFHDASDLQSGTSVPFTVRTRNLGELDEVNLNVQVSENAKLLVNSEAVELRNGETQTLTASDNSIQWQGVLAQGAMLLEDNSLWDDYLLSEQEVIPIACDEGCGFVNAVVEFDFQFNGNHYQTLTLSDNGFVVPGQQSFGFITALFNQPFPQQDQLNNVIAPFWTEFDLLDENVPSDTGGGYLRAAVRVVDDVNYLIVEWDKVVPYSLPEEDEGELPTDPFPEDPIPEDPAPDLPDSPPPGGDPLDSETESFTFQLIIQENTDNIWFKYYNIPYLPEALSIGAENEDGRVGINYHFDGTGNDVFNSLSESSKTMRLTTLPEGRSIITFDVELHGEQDYAQPDSYNLMEDTEAGLPVLDNDRDYSFATITSDTGADSIFSAVSSARIPATGGLDSNSLTIMAQPSHGIATVENGAILYQPNADYFGADQFSYQVTDASGDHISSTNVALEISPVNDAPIIGEINAGSDFVVSKNQMLSFTVPASDVDNETLSLLASATSSGVMPTFTIDGMQVNMNGLSVSQDTSIQLQLVVSDGIDQSAPVTVTISIENEDSGGSITWLLALLLSCCGRRFTRSSF